MIIMANNSMGIDRLAADTTAKAATAWVRQIVRVIGVCFHPDEPFSSYRDESGAALFTPERCVARDADLARAWDILDSAGMDIYAIGLSEQRRILAVARCR